MCDAPHDPAACPSELRTVVFSTALRNGGQAEYTAIRTLFANAQSDAERRQVLQTMGSTPARELQLQTLDWTSSGAVKLQDFFFPMVSVAAASSQGLELMWKYFQDNFARLKGLLASASPSLMDAVLSSAISGFTSAQRADEAAAFFEAHPLPANNRKIQQILETIRVSSKFSDRLSASTLAQDGFWKN